MKKIALSLLTMLLTLPAFGHARWQMNGNLPPRTDNAGIKQSGAPCGTRKYNTRTKLQAGQTLNIQWVETIDHPGQFEIWFSQANDSNWQRLKVIQDDQAGRQNTPHYFTNTITVPNVTCTDCTFQLRQWMTDKNPPSYYFSCADVDISPNNPPLGGTPKPPPPSSNPPPPHTCND